MKKYSHRHTFIPASLVFLLGFVFMPVGGPSAVDAKEAAAVSNGDETTVEYLTPDGDLLPPDAKNAVEMAFARWKGVSINRAGLSVFSIRWEEDWALATAATANLNNLADSHELSKTLLPFVLVYDRQEWKAALRGDPAIASLLEKIPNNELSLDAKNALFAEPGIFGAQAYNDYKFPWLPGNPWIARGAWHGSGNRALDFRPDNNINTDVIAAAPGHITALAQCNPSGHAILNITTENTNEYLGYTHLDGASVQAEGLKVGDYVSQGRKLGIMAPNAFSGSDTCNIISTGMHLHILMPTKPFTMDGKTFSDSYIYDDVDLYSTQAGSQTTFADVLDTYWASSYIESLYTAGITGGCGLSPLVYCPEATVTRSQMAVFLLRGEHGSGYAPPSASGAVFDDVSSSYWAAGWIEQLSLEGITGGCGTKIYCPDAVVSRAQMAIFLLRTKHGASYSPPPATGTFADVPADYWAAAWIEQLAAEGVTSGCSGGNYCPDQSVTRAQMAVFLVKNFNLP